MPIEITWPEFWKVEAMPEPMPRRQGGRLFMIAARLPHALHSGLIAHGVSPADAVRVAHLSPVSTLFASLLGANPLAALLGHHALQSLTHQQLATITSRTFFPRLISPAFAGALSTAFTFSFIAFLVAAAASWLRGGTYAWSDEDVGAEQAVAEPAVLSG